MKPASDLLKRVGCRASPAFRRNAAAMRRVFDYPLSAVLMDAAAGLGYAAGTITTRHDSRPGLGRDAEIADRLDRTAGPRAPEAGGHEGARGGHVINLRYSWREVPGR